MWPPNLFRLWLLFPLLCAQGCATQTSRPPAEEAKPRPALSQEDLRQRVEALLSGYERIPTEEDFRPLGPGALVVLEQIFLDPARLPTQRTRAVASMALVESPQAEQKLKEILSDPKIDVQYRSTAVLALAHRSGAGALGELRPLLEDKDASLRHAAARALGRVGTLQARRSLEERLGKEPDPAVREAIQQSLTKTEP